MTRHGSVSLASGTGDALCTRAGATACPIGVGPALRGERPICDTPAAPVAGDTLILSDCDEPRADGSPGEGSDSGVELAADASEVSADEPEADFWPEPSGLKNDTSEEKIDSPEDGASGMPDDAVLATMSPPAGGPAPPSEANTTLVVAPEAVAEVLAVVLEACDELPRTDCWRIGAPMGAAAVAPEDDASVMSPAAVDCIVGAHPASASVTNARESVLCIAVRALREGWRPSGRTVSCAPHRRALSVWR